MKENYSEEFLEEKIKELIDKHHRPANEVLLDDVDIRTLLKISRRTSLEYRKKAIYPLTMQLAIA